MRSFRRVLNEDESVAIITVLVKNIASQQHGMDLKIQVTA